ncbi:hypothetical protein BC937DRAFT_95396, partial [Endogone sp. FLAS-F59071]
MPSPELPPEILTIIFTLVTHHSLDLISCCLVCLSWYTVAFPLIMGHPHLPCLGVHKYTNDELDRLAKLWATARDAGVALGPLTRLVEVTYGNVIGNLGTGVYAILDELRLASIRGLLQGWHTCIPVSLHLHNTSDYLRLNLLNELVTRLVPRMRIMCINKLTMNDPQKRSSLQFIRSLLHQQSVPGPPHPIVSLIARHYSYLVEFHLFESGFTIELSYILRQCPNIQTVILNDIYVTLPPDHFAETVGSWPNLTTLILKGLSGKDNQPKGFLAPTVRRLANAYPSSLSTLELHDYIPHDPTTMDLSRLLTACAHTVSILTLPPIEKTHKNADRLLTHLATLHMPHLKQLDLSNLDCDRLGGRRGRDGIPPLAWPELRELTLGSCRGVRPSFVEAVLEDCAKIECVHVRDVGPRAGQVRAMLVRWEFVESADKADFDRRDRPWRKKKGDWLEECGKIDLKWPLAEGLL